MTLTAKGMGIGVVIALVIGGAGASLLEMVMLKRMFRWRFCSRSCARYSVSQSPPVISRRPFSDAVAYTHWPVALTFVSDLGPRRNPAESDNLKMLRG